MARKKTKTDAADNGLQEIESPNGVVRPQPANKTDAVRMAIEAGHSLPRDGSAYIKSEYGLDVNPLHFSSTKTRLGAGAAKKTPQPRGRKPKAAENVAEPARKSAKGEAGLLDAMEAIKPLVESMGKDQVKRLIDLLG